MFDTKRRFPSQKCIRQMTYQSKGRTKKYKTVENKIQVLKSQPSFTRTLFSFNTKVVLQLLNKIDFHLTLTQKLSFSSNVKRIFQLLNKIDSHLALTQKTSFNTNTKSMIQLFNKIYSNSAVTQTSSSSITNRLSIFIQQNPSFLTCIQQ